MVCICFQIAFTTDVDLQNILQSGRWATFGALPQIMLKMLCGLECISCVVNVVNRGQKAESSHLHTQGKQKLI